ncbi:hypothetical protein OG689_40275 [Kitasatospora sp. NBC_00240]|uniref:hypothetical protein n=1 Tax=Kitasatospora sp. NBC_00240 TaxID=2903567 RepID=UPI0022578D2B|nr:hypothetical protein [Kitasatospora sp. NBC_00240]MCX5215415.1 hypothetical protein [Kitasatospora sp. NBC_00240]
MTEAPGATEALPDCPARADISGATPFELPGRVALTRPVDELPTRLGLSLSLVADGWRAVLRTGPDARIFTPGGADLGRSLADLLEIASGMPTAVLDGNVLAVLPGGATSLGLLRSRAGAGPRWGEPFAVRFAAFDLLALTEDWRPRPQYERQERLSHLLDGGPRAVRALPAVSAASVALHGINLASVAVLARPTDLPYLPGHESGWLTYRCPRRSVGVIVGIVGRSSAQPSAVIACPDSGGRLRPVAVTLPLPAPLREELAPLLDFTGGTESLPAPLGRVCGRRWAEYHTVRPDLVLEVDSGSAGIGICLARPRAVRVRTDIGPDRMAMRD